MRPKFTVIGSVGSDKFSTSFGVFVLFLDTREKIKKIVRQTIEDLADHAADKPKPKRRRVKQSS